MRTLVLFHHDPWRTDDEIDAIEQHARQLAGDDLEVRAAYEGLVLDLGGSSEVTGSRLAPSQRRGADH